MDSGIDLRQMEEAMKLDAKRAMPIPGKQGDRNRSWHQGRTTAPRPCDIRGASRGVEMGDLLPGWKVHDSRDLTYDVYREKCLRVNAHRGIKSHSCRHAYAKPALIGAPGVPIPSSTRDWYERYVCKLRKSLATAGRTSPVVDELYSKSHSYRRHGGKKSR